MMTQFSDPNKYYALDGASVAAGRVVLSAPYHFDFCVGFSQITVNCLVATVVTLTRRRSRHTKLICQRSFVAVLSTITAGYVCSLKCWPPPRRSEHPCVTVYLLAWCTHVASCCISVRRRVQSPRHTSTASRPPAYCTTAAAAAVPVHDEHVRLFTNMTQFYTWAVLCNARVVDRTAVAQPMNDSVNAFSSP